MKSDLGLPTEQQGNIASGQDSRTLEEIAQENLLYTKAIYEDTQKIRRYMLIRTTINVVWLVLIFTPLLIAFIYLPPAVKELYQTYQDLMGQSQGAFDLFDQLNQLR